MNDAIIKTEGLRRAYRMGSRELEVLKGINLQVGRGELLIIQGPSGAGKSTLLHLLAGFDEPTAGKVFIDGIDLYKLSEGKRAALRGKKIGFVFQFYHLLPEFTVLENVLMPALINGSRRSRELTQRALGILDVVRLSQRVSHRPGELSGGEMQRAAIARSLINNPEIIFCDEPTGNLDSKTGKEIFDVLYALNTEQNKTVVVVTHDAQIALRARRVLNIRDGSLLN